MVQIGDLMSNQYYEGCVKIPVMKSITEFKKQYLPKKYKKELWDKMTPEKKGIYMAKETMDNIRQSVKIFDAMEE